MKISVDTQLGVFEYDQSHMQANLAPNPATNTVTVFFSNPKAGEVRLAIHTLQGQVVMSEEEHFDEGEQQYELQLGDLSKGFYLLRVETDYGTFETLKLMKQ